MAVSVLGREARRYRSPRLARRPLALALTAGLHGALVILLILPAYHRSSMDDREDAAMTLFEVPAIRTSQSQENVRSRASSAVDQAAPHSAISVDAPSEPSTVADSRQGDQQGTRGTPGAADPFSSPALAAVTSDLDHLTSTPTIAVHDVIDGLYAGILLDTLIAGCTRTASFVATVLGNGRLSGVRFIDGSLGPGPGERLARAIEANVVFAPSADGSGRRTVIGPVALKSPKAPEGSAATGVEVAQCRG